MLSRAMSRAPEASSRLSTVAVRSAGTSRMMALPQPLIRPRRKNMSLCANGTPCSGPMAPPRASAESAAAAAASAPKSSIAMKAFNFGCTAWARAKAASVTSREDSFRVRIASATSTSDRSVSSAMSFALRREECQGRGQGRRLLMELRFGSERHDGEGNRRQHLGAARRTGGLEFIAVQLAYQSGDVVGFDTAHTTSLTLAGAWLWPEPGSVIRQAA